MRRQLLAHSQNYLLTMSTCVTLIFNQNSWSSWVFFFLCNRDTSICYAKGQRRLLLDFRSMQTDKFQFEQNAFHRGLVSKTRGKFGPERNMLSFMNLRFKKGETRKPIEIPLMNVVQSKTVKSYSSLTGCIAQSLGPRDKLRLVSVRCQYQSLQKLLSMRVLRSNLT